MNFIHEFWTTNFPFFNDIQFIYYFLDIATIYVLIECILIIPKMLLRPRIVTGGSRRNDDRYY